MKKVRIIPKKKQAWRFKLFVANTSPRSLLAISNLKTLCKQYLQQGYSIRIIDIVKEPAAALQDNVLAIPMLKRVYPGPPKSVVGTLANPEGVLRGLDLASLLVNTSASTTAPRVLQQPGQA